MKDPSPQPRALKSKVQCQKEGQRAPEWFAVICYLLSRLEIVVFAFHILIKIALWVVFDVDILIVDGSWVAEQQNDIN